MALMNQQRWRSKTFCTSATLSVSLSLALSLSPPLSLSPYQHTQTHTYSCLQASVSLPRSPLVRPHSLSLFFLFFPPATHARTQQLVKTLRNALRAAPAHASTCPPAHRSPARVRVARGCALASSIRGFCTPTLPYIQNLCRTLTFLKPQARCSCSDSTGIRLVDRPSSPVSLFASSSSISSSFPPRPLTDLQTQSIGDQLEASHLLSQARWASPQRALCSLRCGVEQQRA